MNTVTVKINGVEYNLKGKENEEYLLEVAKYVDGKFREISANNSKLSTTAVAVLSALNIADEYFKCELENDELNKKRTSLEERYLTLKERLREIKTEAEDFGRIKAKEVENLKSIICSMEEKIKEVDSLYNTINDLQKIMEENNKSFDEEKNSLENAIEEKEEELRLLNLKNEELKNNENILKETIDLKEKEIEDLNCKSSDIDIEEVAALKNDLDKTIKEIDKVKKDNRDLKFKLQNSRYRILDLEKKLGDANFNLAIEKKSKNPLLR